ncbi:MAG: co-chaperone GroES [Bacteroidota bacterium]
MSLNIKPLSDRVLIEPVAAETQTASGIFIPDTAKEKPQKGEIIATGKGRVTEDGKVLPLEVKAGDQVLFGKYAGTELKLNGEELIMMREEDILGIIQ